MAVIKNFLYHVSDRLEKKREQFNKESTKMAKLFLLGYLTEEEYRARVIAGSVELDKMRDYIDRVHSHICSL